MRWKVTNVEMKDFLGFQGNFSQSFDNSTQVIFAKNNTGKSALTMGIQWALTGTIPKIRGMEKRSYSLVNKHAGKERGKPTVTLILKNEDGREMKIVRKGHKEPRSSKPQLTDAQQGEEGIEVDLDGGLDTGWMEAQEVINRELGLTSDTLRQCGVVLQQDILMLIAGQTKDISSVINDTLGLEALSDLVPILEEKAKEAKRKSKDLESTFDKANPLVKWQEKMDWYTKQLEQLEDEAIARGIPKEDVEDPELAIQQHYDDIGNQLELTFDEKDDWNKMCETAIRLYRTNDPAADKRNHAKDIIGNIIRLTGRIKKLQTNWEKSSKQFDKIAFKGIVDLELILKKVADNENELNIADEKLEDLKREDGFLAVANDLLNEYDTQECPLCKQTVDLENLKQDVRDRLSAKIKAEMKEIKREQKRLNKDKKTFIKQKNGIEKFIEKTTSLIDNYISIAENPDYRDGIEFLDYEKDQLFTGIGFYKEPIKEMNRIRLILGEKLDEWNKELSSAIEEMNTVETFLSPLENKLREIDTFLRQIQKSNKDMEKHHELKAKAIDGEGALKKSLKTAKEFTAALQKIKKEITSQQLERANTAIKSKIPMVNELFSKIAGNPDYDSINAQAKISSGKIQYELNAESSKIVSLGDKVCHVLSEGNLHVAGLSLLLALSRGEKHNLGFVILDDPGQGMDDDTIDRFSQMIMSLEDKPQIILLTHQERLATAMEVKGAARDNWGTWEGGRIIGP